MTMIENFLIELGDNASIAFQVPSEIGTDAELNYVSYDVSAATANPLERDQRIVVIGIDFGTSSTKVVIGDAALGRAFAVPFRGTSGISDYLLASRLYHTDGIYSLTTGFICHRDLKLSLFADPANTKLQDRVIGFLAHVIRYSLGWFLSTKADIYSTTSLLWKVVIGLPTANHLEKEISNRVSKLGDLAWRVAHMDGEVSDSLIACARKERRIEKRSASLIGRKEDVEVEVIPEIAAQIFGFVKSHQFDPASRNIFLMVDVGAGTVDSSLFQVCKGRGGVWDFEFFTSVVEPNGVMNLHRWRTNWWQEGLKKASTARADRLCNELAKIKLPTDRSVPIPPSFRDYFGDTSVLFKNDAFNPDEIFYSKRIVRQVRGNTYWRTREDCLLSQSQLTGIPAFYCGGGIRHQMYGRLREEMQAMPGCTWLSAFPRQIEIPSDLEVPGVSRIDYDRLSVAYGLSFLEAGKIVKSLPAASLSSSQENPWDLNYG